MRSGKGQRASKPCGYRWTPSALRKIDVRDQLAAVTELLTSHNTTIETSLSSTIASLAMPDFVLRNRLSDEDLAALRARLIT